MHTATLYGRKLEVTDDGVAKLRKTITDAGYYAYQTTPEETEQLSADPDAVTQLFAKLMHETLGRWLELAEDKLAGSGASITRLAHGLPVGGELDYLDDGTLTAALQARRKTG